MLKYRFILFWVVLLSVTTLFHWNYLNRELTGYHVWRQTQTQSTILYFYENPSASILDPKQRDITYDEGLFRMEFPLMQYAIAKLFKVTGPSVPVTRITMLMIGLMGVVGMYFLGLTVFRQRTTAMAVAWCYSFSPAFFYYTITPLPDIAALTFAIWGLFFAAQTSNSLLTLFLSGLFLSFAALCKLPFIVFYSVPCMGFLIRSQYRSLKAILCLALPLIAPISWYAWVIPTWHHTGIRTGIFDHEDGWYTLFDYLQSNLISTLPELLLNFGSVPFFIIGLWATRKHLSNRNPLVLAFAAGGISVLLFFFYEINMIGKVHDYYLFPFLPFLFLIVGYGFKIGLHAHKYSWYLILALILVLPFTAYLRGVSRWHPNHVGFNKDFLDHKEALKAEVPDSAKCIVGSDESHFIYFYFIHKNGWGFHGDKLSEEQLNKWAQAGAEYIYSDSEKVNTMLDKNPKVRFMRAYGSIRVYHIRL